MKINFSIPKTIDWTLYIVPILLTTAGVVVIYSLTYYNNRIYLTYNQIVYAAIGLILMIALTFIDYRNFKALAPYLYLIGTLLLVAVLFFGDRIFGAARWLDLRVFQLQPSEIFKFCLIIVLARYFSDKMGKIRIKDLLFFGGLMALPIILVGRQPDLGTLVVLIFIALVILVAAKPSRKQLLILGLILIILTITSWFFLKDYQKQRIYTFMNPQSDQFGAGYNVNQAMIAVGSGGLWGRGLGHGPQSQLNFLPVAHTDFIFAGLAEAGGFAGASVVIILFTLFVTRIVNIAAISKDHFGLLLAVGFSAMFLFQFLINIGMNLGIMPVTGIPLPFVSHGGTALIMSFIGVGILQSIYLRHKRISF